MRKRNSRKAAAFTALCLMTSAMTIGGCGSRSSDTITDISYTEDSKETGEKAMGRYLETDVNLPEGSAGVEAMELLNDGTIAVVYWDRQKGMCLTKSGDKGESWDEPKALAELLGTDGGREAAYSAIAPDGGIFAVESNANTAENMDEIEYRYEYLSKDGKVTELPLGETVGKSMAFRNLFTEEGELLMQTIRGGILQVNVSDGSLVRTYEEGNSVEVMGTAGNRLIVVTDGTLHYYDLKTGAPLEDCEALTSQVSARKENMELTSTSSFPVLFTGGDEGDSLFYVDKGGIYRYAAGGSVVEQLADAALNSLSAPQTAFQNFIRDDDGNFYVGVSDFGTGDSVGKILKYTYSPDTPAVPDTELTVYSLKENEFIRQAAAAFQKKYPDIYLNVENGMSGGDAVTGTDALKTLNTEIMAGKGPDVLMLDGIAADTYIGKGMLADISGILKDTGILENIRNAYTNEDGTIYEMPGRFAIPVMIGKKTDLEKAVDLKGLADVIESHKAEYSDKFLPQQEICTPETLLMSLADTSSAAWLQADGTVNEEAVKEYLTQANRIYQAAASAVEAWMEKYGVKPEDLSTMSQEYDKRYTTTSSRMLIQGFYMLNMGGIYSPEQAATMYSLEKADDSFGDILWNGQAENCFVPRQTVGISAKSGKQEAAGKFLAFLFSEEGQSIAKSEGLPVKQSVYENMDYWINVDEDVVASYSDSTEDGVMNEFTVYTPKKEQAQSLIDLGKKLTTPADDNEIILNAVTEGGAAYLKGESSLEDAAAAIIRQVNLYLSE